MLLHSKMVLRVVLQAMLMSSVMESQEEQVMPINFEKVLQHIIGNYNDEQ